MANVDSNVFPSVLLSTSSTTIISSLMSVGSNSIESKNTVKLDDTHTHNDFELRNDGNGTPPPTNSSEKIAQRNENVTDKMIKLVAGISTPSVITSVAPTIMALITSNISNTNNVGIVSDPCTSSGTRRRPTTEKRWNKMEDKIMTEIDVPAPVALKVADLKELEDLKQTLGRGSGSVVKLYNHRSSGTRIALKIIDR
jgi:hypothetical protein